MEIDRVLDGGSEARPSRLPAWPKACDVCAMKPHDPQSLGTDTRDDLRNLVASGDITFFCLHRTTTAGRHRECACAAAITRGRTHDR